MLYLVGIIITFFLVFILIGKKGKSAADKILATWLFFTGVHLILFYIHFTAKYQELPYLLGLEIPFPLLHGPFLYLYTATLTNLKPGKWWQIHFTPFIVGYFFLIPFFSTSGVNKIAVYKSKGAGYETLMMAFLSAILISGIIYSLLSFKKLIKHKRNIIDQFTYTESINLAWLRYLIIGTSVIWLVAIFGEDQHIFATVVAYIFFIGYFGIKQVGVFTNKPPNDLILITEPINEAHGEGLVSLTPDGMAFEPGQAKTKYEKSGLNLSDLQTIHTRLTQLMQKEKLYKNPELTLLELSQKLCIHPNVLSQVINSIEQKNLYDYVNQQRVEEFKKLVALPENQKFTLLSLAFECGYNSKTAFNRNFKKETGVSPTAYLKQVNVTINQD